MWIDTYHRFVTRTRSQCFGWRRRRSVMILLTVVAAHGCAGASDKPADSLHGQDATAEDGPVGGQVSPSASHSEADTDSTKGTESSTRSRPECESASDCFLASDCCYCEAMPQDAVWGCPADCGRLLCDVLDIDASDVLCLNGRCVLDRTCGSGVTCEKSGPTCPEDGVLPPMHRPPMTAMVEDGCWGGCIAVSECSDFSE